MRVNWIHTYTYPPEDYVSWLFLILNQHVRGKIHELIEEKNLSDTVVQEIIDTEIISKKLDSTIINTENFFTSIKLGENTVLAKGIIELSRFISKKIDSIKYLMYLKEEEEKESITITIRDGKDLGIYDLDLINVYKGTKILLKYFLERDELELLNTGVQRIHNAIIKSYVAIKNTITDLNKYV